MNCGRCGGQMYFQRFYARDDGDSFDGFKCIACGEIIDPQILENRRLQRKGLYDMPRREVVKSKLTKGQMPHEHTEDCS